MNCFSGPDADGGYHTSHQTPPSSVHELHHSVELCPFAHSDYRRQQLTGRADLDLRIDGIRPRDVLAAEAGADSDRSRKLWRGRGPVRGVTGFEPVGVDVGRFFHDSRALHFGVVAWEQIAVG